MPLGSATAKNAVLDASLGPTQATNIPDPLYLALFTDNPATTGVELSGGGYARTPIPKGSWQLAASGLKKNDVVVSFAPSTGVWGTAAAPSTPAVATYCALMDAATSGTRWDIGTLGTTVSVTAADTVVSFARDAITVSEA